MAMELLGILYENGLGVATDHQKAHEWYQKAREHDNTNVVHGS